jgi:septal ring factor EnvC (AmiA/AmiB activator)
MTEPLTINTVSEPESGALEPSPFQKLVIVPSQTARDPRPVTGLAKVFGQFTELQHQISGQVSELENSIEEQRQEVSSALSQLPEMRERINWLISSFWEQSKKDDVAREQLARHDASLQTLEETVHSLCAAQAQWKSALEEVIDILLRARAFTVPSPPPSR